MDEAARRRERMRRWREEQRKKKEAEAFPRPPLTPPSTVPLRFALGGGGSKRSAWGARRAPRVAAAAFAATATDAADAGEESKGKGCEGAAADAPRGVFVPPRRKRERLDGKGKQEEEGEESAPKKARGHEEEVDPLDTFMERLDALGGSPSAPAARDRVFGDEEAMGEEDVAGAGGGTTASDGLSWTQRQQAKAKRKDIGRVDHEAMDYAPFRKNFYTEAKDIAAMSEAEVRAYRAAELEGVRIRGLDCPRPVKKWSQCGLPERAYKVIARLGYERPFPIQAQALPAIMSGRDCIGCARTGSGKTMAFVLPLLRHALDQPRVAQGEGPVGLVLAPTRELAAQIHAEVRRFARACGLRSVAVYGGTGIGEQIGALRAGVEVVVATPGRLIDILSTNGGRVTNLARVTYLVLDEADRMFDLGFEPQIMRIVENTRPDRQTVMFSATFPRAVERLAKRALRRPVEIVIGGRSVASGSVAQTVEVRPEETKFRRLLELLGQWYERGNVLVFTDRQDSVDSLFRQLQESGYPCLALHGGMDQDDRDYTIQDFRQKMRTLMVATSVVARGLDVKDLVLVVNYTAPGHYEDYVHRVGRTGRAGRKGTAVTFVSPAEASRAPDLVRALEAAKQQVPDDLRRMAEEFKDRVRSGEARFDSSGFGGRGFRFDEEEAEAVAKMRAAQSKDFGGGDGGGGAGDKAGDGDGDGERTLAAKLQREADSAARAEAKAKAAMAKPAAAPNPFKAQMEAAKRAAAAAKQALESRENAKEAAAKVLESESKRRAAEVARALSAKAMAVAAARGGGGGGGGAAGGGGAGLVRSTGGSNGIPLRWNTSVEVNDYPQEARKAATKKGAAELIMEETGVTIFTKGSYIPPGRKPRPGEQKLFFFIEGTDRIMVERARVEVVRLLEEASVNATPDEERYGRFQLLLK